MHQITQVISSKWLENVIESLKEAWTLACIKTVAEAKRTNTYKDRTNNLRSSIGYVLFFDGKLISDSFAEAGSGSQGTGEKGVFEGMKLAEEAAKKYPAGFIAVIVAGMDYALYVEAKGFDVLSGATLRFPEYLREYMGAVGKAYGIKF